MVLVVSELLVKKGTIPRESVTLEEGGGDAVLWRFACDLVLLGPFLLA